MNVTWDIMQIWLGAMFTVFVYTFSIKSNPLYRLSEHILIGTGAGYATVLAINLIRRIAWTPLTTTAEWTWIIPIIFGLTLYFRFSRKYYWVNRYGIAVLVAIGTAVTMRTIIAGQVLSQIVETLVDPFATVPASIVGPIKTPVNNIIIILFVILTIFFFIFTGGSNIQKSRSAKHLSKFAIYIMMFAFGATFGLTIMGRTAEMYARVVVVLAPEALPVLPISLLLVVLALVPREQIKKICSRNK